MFPVHGLCISFVCEIKKWTIRIRTTYMYVSINNIYMHHAIAKCKNFEQQAISHFSKYFFANILYSVYST